MHSPAKVTVPGRVCPHCDWNTLSFMAWAGRNAAFYHCCAPHCGRIVRIELAPVIPARERVSKLEHVT